jgi:hypothetical protein
VVVEADDLAVEHGRPVDRVPEGVATSGNWKFCALPLRLMRVNSSPSNRARTRRPSYFGSLIQSGWSNGSAAREASMGADASGSGAGDSRPGR